MTENIQFSPPVKSRPPKRRLVFVLGGIVLIILIVFAWMVYNAYLSPEARESREMQENFDRAIEIQEQLEQQAKADIYGGKTPEQTLALFVEALRNEDTELASKYFWPDVDEENPTKLTRKKWLDMLNSVQENDALQKLADDLENYSEVAHPYNSSFMFIYKNDDGITDGELHMRFNEYSDVWKIENIF